MNDKPLHIRAAEARDQRGWTQRQAAEEAGMSLRAYTNFEAGRTTPQGKNLRGILRALELDGEEEPTVPQDHIGPTFPRDVQTFLNMLGAFLLTMDEDARLEWIYEETRHIFSSVYNTANRSPL